MPCLSAMTGLCQALLIHVPESLLSDSSINLFLVGKSCTLKFPTDGGIVFLFTSPPDGLRDDGAVS